MPTVVPTDSRPLSWPPIGALPRNRLASSATGSASPISPTPRLLHSLKRFRRAGCPHPADPDLHRTSCKNHVIAKPVRTLAAAIRNTPAPAYADRGSLSFCGERKGGKNAVKTKVLKSFPRLRCRLHRSSLPRVSGCANFAPCFRIVSASPSATRSALVPPWRDGGKLRVCRAAA